jgi:hypothetical protein
MQFRKDLSAPGLYVSSKRYFSSLNKKYPCKGTIKSSDVLMSGLAMFSLKFPSLLQFDSSRNERQAAHNLKHLYLVEHHPSDTYMRTRLDEISPADVRGVFRQIFTKAQRGKALERFKYLDDHYLLSIDGTGYFSSSKVHCDNCCQKNHRDGSVTYYHQMLGAAIVHPDEKIVLPLAPEAIMRGDGSKKNDCERNAAKRLLADVRRDHPHLKLIVIEDGLASNGPHIDELKRHDMRFILGAKPGDHEWLFDWVNNSDEVETYSYKGCKKQITLRWLNNVPLSDSRSDLLVNFLECVEVSPGGKTTRFSWITDLELTKKTIKPITKGGRARWKIENETFNTLKNQGYNFEHNFGHGNKNLSTVLAHLMLLAFLIDQIQQLSCKVFNAALDRAKSKTRLWHKMWAVFEHFFIDSWDIFYRMIFEPPHIRPCFDST